MISTVRNVLFHPDEYFATDGVELQPHVPMGVLVSYILLTVGIAVPVVFNFTIDFWAKAATLLGMFLTGSLIILFKWLLFGAVTWGISSVLGGSGSFRRLVIRIGMGYLPLVMGLSCVFIAVLIAIQTIPPVPILSDLQLTETSRLVKADPIVTAALYLYGGTVLWGCYIWTCIVKHICDISVRRAFIAVIIPVILVIQLQPITL